MFPRPYPTDYGLQHRNDSAHHDYIALQNGPERQCDEIPGQVIRVTGNDLSDVQLDKGRCKGTVGCISDELESK
jgi:hypothetical protein